MQLQIEQLENLRVLNFYVSFYLTESAILLKPNASENPDFVNNIFSTCGGEYCLITPEVFALKYSEGANVESVRLLIMAELEDFFAERNNLKNLKNSAPVYDLAQAVADSFIRPTLNRDKGDVELLKIDNGILTLKFTGHCAGCPFAQNTLNNVIAKTFSRYVPQIKEIRMEE